MSTGPRRYKYYPDVARMPVLADQVYCPRRVSFADHAFDGSMYNVYDHEGNIDKAIPLNVRPPIGHYIPGFQGRVYPNGCEPTLYNNRVPQYLPR